jgi:hypothetical protein
MTPQRRTPPLSIVRSPSWLAEACRLQARAGSPFSRSTFAMPLPARSGAALDLVREVKELAGAHGLRHRVQLAGGTAMVHLWRRDEAG